jgi:hypothetical protein
MLYGNLHSAAPPGTAPPSARTSHPPPGPGGPPLFAQFLPDDLVVEEDWSPGRRRRIALVLGLAAAVLLLGGVHSLLLHSHGILWIGLSRLSRAASARGLPGTYLLAALEHMVGALGLGWLALCLAAGAAEPVRPQRNQRVSFNLRQLWQAWAPLLLGGGGVLFAGQVLATGGHTIIAGLVEMAGWALFGAAANTLLLPEARIAVTCVTDLNRGWGNHLLLTGGCYNKGSLVIRHDALISASVVATGWQRVLGCADLNLAWRDGRGIDREVLVRGAGSPSELNSLLAYLYGPFTLSLGDQVLRGSRPPIFRPDQI